MRQLVLLLMASIVLTGCTLPISFFDDMGNPSSAPDFTFTAFDGATYNLTDFRGQVVVLNFWGSWCAPCRDEAPLLQTLSEQYADDKVVFIGIAQIDFEPSAREFVDELGITYLTSMDNGTTIGDAYGVQGIPETYIIDQNGMIVEAIFGPIFDDTMITVVVDRLLGDATAQG